MTTLFDILRKTYLALGQMEVTTATGGSTTTLVDTKLGDTYGEDDLNGSTVFVIRDAAGASAAPEGEAQLITAYNPTTWTATTATFSAAIGAGDTIGIAKNIWPLHTMIEIANDAIASLGTTQLQYATIAAVDGQTEYSIAAAYKHKITRVQLQENTADSNDNRYTDLYGWYVLPSAAGSDVTLILSAQPPAGNLLRVWYESEHPRLSAMSDKLHESIHSELATREVINRALEYQTRRTNGNDQFILQTANKAMDDAREAVWKFSTPKIKRAKIITPDNHYGNQS